MSRFLSRAILLCMLFAMEDVFSQKTDSVQRDFRPSGVRFGTDLLALVRSPLDDSFYGWEASVDVDLHRYYLVMERGQWKRNLASEDETYANDGAYWRAGVDVNFLKKDPDKNMVFLGLRYGWCNFDENLTVLLNDTWSSGTSSFSNTDVNASWMEITGGLRVKIWRAIWLGYTVRYKILINNEQTSNLVSYDIPGYGRTDTSATWGFNYHVLFRIPARRSSVLAKQ